MTGKLRQTLIVVFRISGPPGRLSYVTPVYLTMLVLTVVVEYSKTVIFATHMVISRWKFNFAEDGRLYVGEEVKKVERGYLR